MVCNKMQRSIDSDLLRKPHPGQSGREREAPIERARRRSRLLCEILQCKWLCRTPAHIGLDLPRNRVLRREKRRHDAPRLRGALIDRYSVYHFVRGDTLIGIVDIEAARRSQ